MIQYLQPSTVRVDYVAENCEKSSKRQSRSEKQDQRSSRKKAKVQPDEPQTAAVKLAGRAKQPQKAKAALNADSIVSQHEGSCEAQAAVVGSGRQAAQGAEYKEKAALALPDSKVAVKQEQIADSEAAALDHSKSDTDGPRRQVHAVSSTNIWWPHSHTDGASLNQTEVVCRLTDFQLIDEQGDKQALESADLASNSLFITGC